jgi:hypothetical protein
MMRLVLPMIDTLVYVGQETDQDDGRLWLFKDPERFTQCVVAMFWSTTRSRGRISPFADKVAALTQRIAVSSRFLPLRFSGVSEPPDHIKPHGEPHPTG